MAVDTKFRAYGENAATFLIFQALATRPCAVSQVLLANLKGFGTGRTRGKKWSSFNDAGVWLFPNFGKRHGFGEPDALVLAGDHVFYVEVETAIDCQVHKSSLLRALVQLWRFRLFQQALTEGVRNEGGARRIMGRIPSNNGKVRDASVRIAGHGVLSDIRKRLEAAGASGNDHYVLFCVHKPAGEGKGGEGYAQVLSREADDLSKRYPPGLRRLPLERCWYASWKSDLEDRFNRAFPNSPLDLGSIYVRIRRS